MYLLIQDSSQTTNNTLLVQILISPKSKHQIPNSYQTSPNNLITP
jgi:hypothetical protein